MTAARPIANDRAYRTIPELFAAQASARPDAPAVLSSAGVLTYGGLEARANQLSRLLRRRGVGPDVPVAVCLERTSEMIVAVLAILKAGGAYMPLEPTYPVDRLAFMLTDARAALIISEESLITRLPNDRGPVLVLEALRQEASGEPLAPLDGGPGADDLAYLMYTSGSTGTPKGVAVPHRAIDRLVCDVDYARLGREETLLHAAPLGFDASTFEIWARS